MPFPADLLDLILDDIANNGDLLCICSSLPSTYSEATSTYKLADEALVTGYSSSDYSKASGGGGSRVLTVAAQTDIPCDSSGTASYVVIVDTVAEEIKAAISLQTPQSMTSGSLYDLDSFTITIGES